MLPAFQKEDWATYEPLKIQYQHLVKALEPAYIGPTWKRDKDGKFILPERTLGWQVIEWCYEWLDSPAGSGPLVLTDEQARFLLWWYALDEKGRYAYRAGVLQRLKGWGKDPTVALLACVEMVGPSQFGGWDEAGEPIGVPHPNAWVQIAAVSQTQTQNTGNLFPQVMSDRLRDAYGIKLSAASEVIRADHGRKRIELVTSNARTLEGNRPTFVIMNEPHHWVGSNGGPDMYAAIQRNSTKTGGRYLAITNAYLPGEDSVAERMRTAHEAVQAGLARDTRVLYDSIEAHPDTPLTPEALEIVIPKIQGDGRWTPLADIIDAVQDVSISPALSRRMWLNQVVAGEDSLYQPRQWDPMERPGEHIRPGEDIVLGFDGGKTDDATALVAMRVSDMFIQPLGIWQKPDHYTEGKWEVNREEVDSAVHRAFRTFNVKGMYCDIALWESYIAEWQRMYSDRVAVEASAARPFEWDMRASGRKSVTAHEALISAIFDGKLRHPGQSTELSRLMRMHVLAVKRRDTPHGVSFGKASRESPHKIDAYAALMLAYQCLLDYRQRGKEKRSKGNAEVFFF